MQNQVIRNGVKLKPSQLEAVKRRFANRLTMAMDEGKETRVEYFATSANTVRVKTSEKINGHWFTIDEAYIGPKGKIL